MMGVPDTVCWFGSEALSMGVVGAGHFAYSYQAGGVLGVGGRCGAIYEKSCSAEPQSQAGV